MPREVLARAVGKSCNLELVIDDIRAEVAGRPYELVAITGGWQHRTKKAFGDVICALPISSRSRAASCRASSARRCRAI
ncbi:hypothetical protein MPLA_2130151 [Mesorhizobium sp. ORS 3359]|nr:hypothetical protein MPLA_2130151 [Mesorhizobium sp. ORS 3359]